MRYFSISQGPRGCYMPDDNYIIAVETRRELKKCLENEAYYIRDAGFLGVNKKAVAWLAASAWRNRDDLDSYCVPYRNAHHGASYCYALFCQRVTRTEYLDHQDD